MREGGWDKLPAFLQDRVRAAKAGRIGTEFEGFRGLGKQYREKARQGAEHYRPLKKRLWSYPEHKRLQQVSPNVKTSSVKTAAFPDLGELIAWIKSRPELVGGAIGGLGGAGIGAMTAEEGNVPRRALVGGLTGATLGGLGGAFFRELGLGSDMAMHRGYEAGLEIGRAQGKKEISEKTLPVIEDLSRRLQGQAVQAQEARVAQEAQAAEQAAQQTQMAQQAAQQVPAAPQVGTMAPGMPR